MGNPGAKRKKASATPPQERVWTPWLTQAAFVLTLALLIARAMMSETIRESMDPVPGQAGPPRGAGPAGTLLLDALCLLPAILVLVRRSVERQYIVRLSWSQGLLALVALWAACSFAWSSDRFLTLIEAANLIAAAALVWSTAQLVRGWGRMRVVAGVAVGLLMIYAAQGLIYRLVDVPENVRFWNENRDRILQERGWEPDSFSARQFEKKLLGGEMIGFNTSPNSFAAVIVLLSVIAAGASVQRFRNGDGIASAVATALPVVPALVVIGFTHSRTALGTLFIAACALAALSMPRLRAWLAEHWRLAYAIGVATVIFGAVALIGHGVYHGSLPHDSLNFRWRYWVAGWRLFTQDALTGVGWGNFGQHYLSMRLPAAAEEVRDPHNFLVRAFVELGMIGGALVLAWLARAAWEVVRPIHPPARAPAPATAGAALPVASSTASSGRAAFLTIVAVAALGVLLNILFSIDFAQPSAFITLELFRRFLALGLLCVGLVIVAIRSRQQQDLDDRPAPWLLYALLIGLGVFFVHNMMDFALSEAGPMTLFAVLLGAALGARTPSAAGLRQRQKAARVALGVLSVGWLSAMLLVVIPVADAEQQAHRADEAIRAQRPDVAAGLYLSAYENIRFNADYAYRAARAHVMASSPPEQVKAMLDLAIHTSPTNALYRLTRAEFERRLPNPDPAAVRRDYEAALALDPQGMLTRLDYAAALERFGDNAEAARQYRLALQTNSAYDAAEPKRLTPERASEVEKRAAQLEAAVGTGQGASSNQ